MRNLYRNSVILLFAGCFLAFNLIGETTADAQTRQSIVKTPTPTPKKKKSPTIIKTTPKPTPKSSPVKKTAKTSVKTKSTTAQKDKSDSTSKTADESKPTPKPSPSGQIIVAAAVSRIRQQPKLNSPQLTVVKLGRTLPVYEKTATWYQVEYASGKIGWISKTLIKDFDSADRDAIYREIADKYVKNKSLDLATASEVLEFLREAQALVKKDALKAELGLKRLRVLGSTLKTIPFGKSEENPYKNFIKANEKEIVYSDPSGEWLVRSDLFWELHGRYVASAAIAEDIAWAAAQNPIPGECEGYVNCNLYQIRATDGEYLNFYPNGKYSKNALKNITDLLAVMVADVNDKQVFTPPSDISDRAEFNRFLTELRTIISKMPDVEKAKTLKQISQLGEGYK